MQDSIVTLAKKLIAIPSVSGEIPQAVAAMELIKKELPEYDFTPFASEQFPSLLYNNKGANHRKFKIILNGHIDVVPGVKEQFNPYINDNKLYGRGAFDMKATLAVKILLFKELANKLSHPLALQIVADEEISGKNGTGYQIGQGVRGDFVLIGECNSNFKVGNAAKGRKLVTITTKGTPAHSGYAWMGENAILHMYEVLDPIVKAFPVPEQETLESTVNITKIETTNKATNKIPDHCAAFLDIRYTQKDNETIIPKIQSLLPSDVKLKVETQHHPTFVDPNNAYIHLLQRITADILGQIKPLRTAHGTSDASFFADVGCNAIEFGPIGSGAHHDEEWVDIKSLVDYYTILKNFLLEVDKMNT